MKNLLVFILFLLFYFSWCPAQKIHTPDELMKFVEKSKITYNLKELKEEITPEDQSSNLTYNKSYRVKTNDGYKFTDYNLSDEAKKYFDQAEEFFQANKAEQALEMYKKTIETDTGYYPAITYIGQSYAFLKEYNKAIEWYQKAIGKSYIDYMAHWFLADALQAKGNLKEALSEITIARILNRNNPRIKTAFIDIYKANKLSGDDWNFEPQYRLTTSNDLAVDIEFKSEWLGYALAKAIWAYEPGYREQMGVTQNTFSSLEEKECLANLYIGILADKKYMKKSPAFPALKFAFDNDYINEYVFYEIVLVEHPSFAFQLDPEFIEKIKEYVILTRGYKCKKVKN